MTKFVVCPTHELPSGTRRVVTIAGRSIGVINIDGEYFALRNRCPHQGGPLCKGPVVGRLESSGPGDLRFDESKRFIQCPWHGWEFDLASGQSWFDPKQLRVRRYSVTIEAADDPPTNVGDAGGQLVKGPYVAETYPVSVAQARVVIELP